MNSELCPASVLSDASSLHSDHLDVRHERGTEASSVITPMPISESAQEVHRLVEGVRKSSQGDVRGKEVRAKEVRAKRARANAKQTWVMTLPLLDSYSVIGPVTVRVEGHHAPVLQTLLAKINELSREASNLVFDVILTGLAPRDVEYVCRTLRVLNLNLLDLGERSFIASQHIQDIAANSPAVRKLRCGQLFYSDANDLVHYLSRGINRCGSVLLPLLEEIETSPELDGLVVDSLDDIRRLCGLFPSLRLVTGGYHHWASQRRFPGFHVIAQLLNHDLDALELALCFAPEPHRDGNSLRRTLLSMFHPGVNESS